MSVFCKFDARSKLVFIFLLTLLVFLVDKLSIIVCLLLSFIVIRLVAKIPFNGFKFFKNLTLLAVFIIVIQTLFGPGENYIVKPLFPPSFPLIGGLGCLKWDGFLLGLVIVCRLSAMMLILPIFTETTPPGEIAAGLCALGINYRTAFIITTAFNLIPLFREEALVIMDAQKLRGMRSFDRGSVFSGIKAYCGLAVPLMLGAMRKTQSSSVSMDSRAFGVYKTRTWIDIPKIKKSDYFFISSCVVFFAVFLIFNYT